MILVIGREDCSNCEELKLLLKGRGIEFEYKDINEIPADERREYVKLSRENGNVLPMIFKDGDNITLQELLKFD